MLMLVLTSVAVPARPLPLLGQLEVSMNWSPGTPPVGSTVTFTTTAADNDGAIRHARLCFGDGSPCEEVVAPSDPVRGCVFGDNWGPKTWHHRYTRIGDFFATITVTSRGCPLVDDEVRSFTAKISVR